MRQSARIYNFLAEGTNFLDRKRQLKYCCCKPPRRITWKMLDIQIYRHWNELQGLSRQWNDLLARCTDASIFLTPEWLQPWAESYVCSGELYVVVGSDGHSDPFLIAPLQRAVRRVSLGLEFRVLRFLGDGTADSDNLNLIVEKGRTGEGVSALLDVLEARQDEWDLLELNTLVAESPVVACLEQELGRRGWTKQSGVGTHRIVPLPDSWDGYLATVSHGMRSQLRRRHRKLESEYGARFWRCENLADLPGALDDLFRLHTICWEKRGKAGSFALPGRCEFYRRMAPRMLERGWLDFWLLRLGERTIAAEFGLCYDVTRAELTGGFDPEFAALAPRNVLKAYVFREAIARGLRYYDFLGGGESHKLRWGGQARSYVHLSAAAPHTRGAVYLSLADSAMRGKEWARHAIPSPVWEAFRKSYRRLRPLPKEVARPNSA